MSPREAVEAYIAALDDVGVERMKHQFKIERGKICLGHVWGEEVDEVQWGMQWHTPKEFAKMAKMRRMDLAIGDPKKPWRKA